MSRIQRTVLELQIGLERQSSSHLLRLYKSIGSFQPTLETPMAESRSSGSNQQQKQLASLLAKRVQNLDPSAKAQFLNELIDNGHNRQLDNQLLLLLQRSIVSGTSTERQPSDDLENALCAVLDFLFKSLLQPQSFQVSMLSVQCINIFLRKQASIHFPLQSQCLSQI